MYCRKNGLRPYYTRAKMLGNIRSAIGVNGTFVEPTDIRNPILSGWQKNGYKVWPHDHWYYAVRLMQNSNGDPIAVIFDAEYEGDYHNNTMQTKPYSESKIRNVNFVITESQLRQIIRESLIAAIYS